MDVSALKIYLAGNPDIQVRELFIPSEDMSDSASSVSNSGDEYIRSHNMLSVPCVPGWVPMGTADQG